MILLIEADLAGRPLHHALVDASCAAVISCDSCLK
jgi:hypothetical protein